MEEVSNCASSIFGAPRLQDERNLGTIGTHNETFHCDEVLACALLHCINEFKDYKIIRSRDPAVLQTCSIVVDFGGVYDHEKRRYDHHQQSFNHTMNSLNVLNFDTKLSSAGLIYAHYGKTLIAELCKIEKDDERIDILYEKMYENFIHSVDAIDNGINQFDGYPRYKIYGTLSDRVGYLNRPWNQNDYDEDAKFMEAKAMVTREFVERLLYLNDVWLPAKYIVKKAIEKRFKYHEKGMIIVLECCVPWKEHFFDLENEMALQDLRITYTIFPSGGTWRVQSIPVNSNLKFDNRLPLPESWRALRYERLSAIAEIPGCVFVHASGFIGGSLTCDGAVRMAKKSLELSEQHTSAAAVNRC